MSCDITMRPWPGDEVAVRTNFSPLAPLKSILTSSPSCFRLGNLIFEVCLGVDHRESWCCDYSSCFHGSVAAARVNSTAQLGRVSVRRLEHQVPTGRSAVKLDPLAHLEGGTRQVVDTGHLAVEPTARMASGSEFHPDLERAGTGSARQAAAPLDTRPPVLSEPPDLQVRLVGIPAFGIRLKDFCLT
jgi:hypothetical protein